MDSRTWKTDRSFMDPRRERVDPKRCAEAVEGDRGTYDCRGRKEWTLGEALLLGVETRDIPAMCLLTIPLLP